MNKRKSIFAIICFIAIDLLLIGSYVFIRNITFMNILNNEVAKLSSYDVFKNDVLSVNSKGRYARVERAFKSYYLFISDEINDSYEVLYDDYVDYLFSNESLLADGPVFVNSSNYLLDYRNRVEEEEKHIMEITSNYYLRDYLRNSLSDSDYELALKMVEKSNLVSDIKTLQSNFKNVKNDCINHSELIMDLYDFFGKYIGNCIYVNDEFIFNTNELNNQYNELMNNIKRIN